MTSSIISDSINSGSVALILSITSVLLGGSTPGVRSATSVPCCSGCCDCFAVLYIQIPLSIKQSIKQVMFNKRLPSNVCIHVFYYFDKLLNGHRYGINIGGFCGWNKRGWVLQGGERNRTRLRKG